MQDGRGAAADGAEWVRLEPKLQDVRVKLQEGAARAAVPCLALWLRLRVRRHPDPDQCDSEALLSREAWRRRWSDLLLPSDLHADALAEGRSFWAGPAFM